MRKLFDQVLNYIAWKFYRPLRNECVRCGTENVIEDCNVCQRCIEKCI
jgi:hypothetical protein